MSYDERAFAYVPTIIADLGSSLDGLTSAEAKNRLQKYGPNVLPAAKKASVTEKFLVQFKNLFNVVLLVASALSFISGWYYSDPTSFQMGFAVLGVVLVNAGFSIVQEYRAEKAVQAISRLIPANAKALRDGQLREVNVSDIVPGDIINLEEGDRVPADARLISAFETSLDNSILTGESDPQRRFASMPRGTPVETAADYQNIVFAGTTVVSGIAKGIVLATGSNTQFGKIVSLSREVKEPPSVLQTEIDYMAKVDFTVAVVVGAAFFAVAKVFVNLTVLDSLLFAIGVMIAMVPEGFQLTVSLSLALTALAMSKRNVVVKRLSSVETLGSASVMCVDKTGTITSGEMMLKEIWANGQIFEVTGDGYSPEGFVTTQNRRLNQDERPHVVALFEVSAFCNNSKLNSPSDRISRWTVLGDPTDGAFLVFAGKGDFNVSEALAKNPRVGLIPFDSKRRLMTSVHAKPDGRTVAYCKGASRELVRRCSRIIWNGQDVPLEDSTRKIIEQESEAFAQKGFRVLGMASRTIPEEENQFSSDSVENNMTFLGLAALFDPPRPMIEKAVSEARSAGIRVIMVTGDHELTAESIAKRTGIVRTDNPLVMSGYELTKISEEELSTFLDNPEIVFARTTPEQKLRIVRALKSKGETVAVTGDGVNDAPALMEAEVGIAMGAGGTDVARESADMVLLDDNFVSMVEGVKLGRAMFDNMRKFVYYVFTHNWAELVSFVAFVLLQVPLPLLVVQVLAIDLGMDIFPSLALIMEPPEPDVMKRSPRKLGSRLIGLGTLVRSLYVGAIVGVGCLAWALQTWMRGGWNFGQATVSNPLAYAMGTTVVLAGIMAGQLGNFFAARTSSQSALRLSPVRNKWLVPSLLAQIGVLAAIVYMPFLNQVFRTAPLPPADWLILYTLAPLVFALEELRKFLSQKIGH